MSIEDLLERGEPVIWQDRPTGPGTRRYGERPKVLIFDIVGPAVLLTLASVGFIVVALWNRDEGWIQTLLIGLTIAALPLMAAGQLRRHLSMMSRAEFHYVLTDKRLISMNMTDGDTVHIFKGGLTRLERFQNNLHVRGLEKDNWTTLADLKDVAAAERVISRTLGPFG